MSFATRQPGGPIDLFERGHWLGPASDMLAGKIPYRDTFPVHGFLADGGLDYLLFAIWQPDFRLSLYAHHFIGVFFQPALFLVTAAATRSILLAALAIPLNLAAATGLVADRPVIPLLALAAFLWAAGENRGRFRALLAGTLAALGLLYALEFGAFVLFAEVGALSLWAIASRGTGPPIVVRSYASGVGLVLIPFLLYLALYGALVPFLKTSFIDLPFHIHTIWGWPFPMPWTLVRSWFEDRHLEIAGLPLTTGIAKRMYLAPVLGIAGIGVAFLLRARGRQSLQAFRLLSISLTCLLFFRYVIARLHLEVGNALVGPVLISILVSVSAATVRPGHTTRFLWNPVAVLLALLFAVALNAPARTVALVRSVATYGDRMHQTVDLVPLTVPRGGGVLVPADEAKQLAALVAACDARVPRGSPILDLSDRPALYFFLNRPNASRFYQLEVMEPFQASVLEELERKSPSLVIAASSDVPHVVDGRLARDRSPLVFFYVDRNYPERLVLGTDQWQLPVSGR